MILTGGRHSWDCPCVECVFGFAAYDEQSCWRLYMALKHKGRRRKLGGRMKKRMGRGGGAVMPMGGAAGPMPGGMM